MKPLGFKYVEIVFKVAISTIIADHLDRMSQFFQMCDHLPGAGRMARSLTGYAVNHLCQAHLLSDGSRKIIPSIYGWNLMEIMMPAIMHRLGFAQGIVFSSRDAATSAALASIFLNKEKFPSCQRQSIGVVMEGGFISTQSHSFFSRCQFNCIFLRDPV